MEKSGDSIGRLPLIGGKAAKIGPILAGPVLVAILLAADIGITGANLARISSHSVNSNAEAVALGIFGALGVVSLGLRRRFPAAVMGALVAATIVEHGLAPAGTRSVVPIALFFAIGSYAAMRPWRKVVEMAAAVIILMVLSAFIRDESAGPYGLYSFLGAVTFVVPISSFGLWIGTNRAYVKELQERSVRLERERELLAARAVTDERVRIARDLHDVVAHSVSLMIVQAGAIRESLPRDSVLRAPLDVLADTGREAMEEMRRMLGVLRQDDHFSSPLAPAPGLREIAGLVARANEAGFEIAYRVIGTAVTLSEAQETCLYRVAQEALTNVVKHTRGASGFVELAFGDGVVRLVVEDRAEELPTDSEPGHGIAGMRERVALFGGTLLAQSIAPGAFRVEATLPLVGAGATL